MLKNALMVVAATALLLAGCGGKPDQRVPKPTDTVVGSDNGAPGGTGTGAAGAKGAEEGDAAGQGGASAPANVSRVIYFDFDSSEIRPEFVGVVAAHAKALARNASVRVRLEGHTDERGSPEYNIGLGERRAQAVKRALLLQGVADSQVTTVSYGEERPAVTGATEASWAKNRRVEFVYLN